MIVILTVFTKRAFIILMTLSSLPAHGQKTKPTGNLKRVLTGVNFSPDYNFRSLKNKDGSSSSGLAIKNRNDMEVAKFGYTAGLDIFFNFTGSAGLETGIQYSNKGYKTKNQDLVFPAPDPALPSRLKFIYTFQYIGIPLKAKFIMGKTKVRFLTGIGFMTNFLLNAKQTNILEYADGRTEKKSQSATSNFKKVDLSPMISLGIDYKLNNKTHLAAEPTFRYGVLKTKDGPVTENLWNAGLNLGFYYGLR